jgi:signal transduction histidine kinase
VRALSVRQWMLVGLVIFAIAAAAIYHLTGIVGRLLLPRPPFWTAPLGALLALVISILFVRWQMGKYLVRPLEAMAAAARQIAAGDLEFELPETRVREVGEVSTAFEAMAEGLRESVKRQAELEDQRRFFIGAIAHDLRTPLFVLRGYLDGLDQGLADSPEKAASYVEICRQKAGQLERLIADLFAYSRTEYTGQRLTFRDVDFDALMRRATESMRAQAEIKQISISAQGPPNACIIEGDEALLERAIENLLDNAVRYSNPGGSVMVGWWREDGRARFSVSDSGPGLSTRDLPHLFEPLYRGESSRNSKTGGAGLGLAIAKRVLEAHGGELRAANRDPHGAALSGWLPLGHPEMEDVAGHRERTSIVSQ